MLIAGFASLLTASLSPTAENFVGEWQCKRPKSGVTFSWRVRDDHKGHWLVGEAEMNGEFVALDVWAYDENGALGKRRQFAMNDVTIEMAPKPELGDTLELVGVYDPGGAEIKMEETVSFNNENEFEAQWRYFDDETNKWVVDSDETCRKNVQ